MVKVQSCVKHKQADHNNNSNKRGGVEWMRGTDQKKEFHLKTGFLPSIPRASTACTGSICSGNEPKHNSPNTQMHNPLAGKGKSTCSAGLTMETAVMGSLQKLNSYWPLQ